MVVTWVELPDAVPDAIRPFTRALIVDSSSVAVVADVRRRRSDVGIVVIARNPEEVRLAALRGADEAILPEVVESAFAVGEIIRRAATQGIARIACDDAARLLPFRLRPVVEAIVLGRAHRVVDLAATLGVYRQTIAHWCRRANAPSPERLVSWCRLVQASAMLELTADSVEQIALELGYTSPTSLRNQMKRYTGVVASEVRERGRGVVLQAFSAAMTRATRASGRRRGPGSPAPDEGSAARS
jgi:AraC-like DNA-binding protein